MKFTLRQIFIISLLAILILTGVIVYGFLRLLSSSEETARLQQVTAEAEQAAVQFDAIKQTLSLYDSEIATIKAAILEPAAIPDLYTLISAISLRLQVDETIQPASLNGEVLPITVRVQGGRVNILQFYDTITNELPYAVKVTATELQPGFDNEIWSGSITIELAFSS